MNIKETTAVLKVLKSSYPNFFKNLTKSDAEDMLEVWSMMFENDDFKQVIEATKAVIQTNVFPPSIADIKEKLNIINDKKETTEIEAWNIVFKAIKNANYQAREYFDDMPDLIKKLVGSPSQLREWALLDSESITVIQSNFMRSYKAKSLVQKEIDNLPASAKFLMDAKTKEVKRLG